MRVDKQLLVSFGRKEIQYKFIQNWPKGSKFLKLITLPEGIFTFFLIPEVLLTDSSGALESDQFTFIIAGADISINDTDQFLDVVSVFTELSSEELKAKGLPPDYQAVVIFPVFLRP